ncbi:MAG: UvrD-helicase domain-containing protein, partial [Thermoleophilia bacterium]|nr:UvrD-helicase domain-containing protein [Thermoleophilia bacterium]
MSHDDDARVAIRERLRDTMLVEAGAGTGKTSALVDRVVALVASGVRIERIAAITFTERAAAELRDRVRTGLEEAQAGASDLIVSGLCQKALEGLDRAQLSTIHAFAQSLLRAYAAEAGVDPELTVLDDLAAGLRFEERWRAALEGMDPDGPSGKAVDRALGLGLRIDGLRGLARRLQERADIAAGVIASPPACPPPEWDALPGLRAAVAAVPLDRVAEGDPC